jgi:ribosome-associated heat shock protein Hsp15
MTQCRLDKWLFHARLCPNRAKAQAGALSGRVRLNGKRVEKPGRTVLPGDILTLTLGDTVKVLKILKFSERRGSSASAKLLYEIVAEEGLVIKADAP